MRGFVSFEEMTKSPKVAARNDIVERQRAYE